MYKSVSRVSGVTSALPPSVAIKVNITAEMSEDKVDTEDDEDDGER